MTADTDANGYVETAVILLTERVMLHMRVLPAVRVFLIK